MTLGEKGALIVTATSSTHVPAMEMSAVDTTGAGDAFNAGLAVAHGLRRQPGSRGAVRRCHWRIGGDKGRRDPFPAQAR